MSQSFTGSRRRQNLPAVAPSPEMSTFITAWVFYFANIQENTFVRSLLSDFLTRMAAYYTPYFYFLRTQSNMTSELISYEDIKSFCIVLGLHSTPLNGCSIIYITSPQLKDT